MQVARSRSGTRTVLRDAGFARVDYFVLVDGATLEPPEAPKGDMRLIAAAVIGADRLIDNIAVEMDHRLNRVNHFFADPQPNLPAHKGRGGRHGSD